MYPLNWYSVIQQPKLVSKTQILLFSNQKKKSDIQQLKLAFKN